MFKMLNIWKILKLINVDSCVYLSHIIDLKQQVKDLEDLNEQLIHSINETLSEIDDVEQMSVQYADADGDTTGG